MANLLDKSLNLGVGLFVYSREKIEEMVDELVNKGEVAKKDAKEFAGELMKKGEEQKTELQNLIKNQVAEVLGHMKSGGKGDFVTRDEINQIVKEQVTQIINEQEINKNEGSK
ncbi:MAG: phasin family protein [Deltaproteobacteria bacterium]